MMSMNRIHNVNVTNQPIYQEFCRKIAIHEAGHATAIYLNNKARNLVPVYFQMSIDLPHLHEGEDIHYLNYLNYQAKIEGGRLIQNLPAAHAQISNELSATQKQAYENALEADIINFLVGPLAEAKYIAKRDDELFNPRLVNFSALQYYGGLQDMEIVKDYLQCLCHSESSQTAKLNLLFLQAYEFVNQPQHWRAITALAQYVLNSRNRVISYDEIVNRIDHSIQQIDRSPFKSRTYLGLIAN